jgi:lipid-A-disaccharide synthase
LCIFPFEEKFYRDAGVSVQFIGHPLVGCVKASMSRAEFCAENRLNADKPMVTILPGSRQGEIEYHGATLAQALTQVRRAIPEVQTVVAVAPGVSRTELEACFSSGYGVRFVTGGTYDALAAADLAIVSSGTATIEAALLGKPMIVIYRLSPLTAKLAKPLVRTKFFSMVNLITGREVVPELIQNDFTPDRVASEAISLLSASKESIQKLEVMRRGLAEVTRLLGPPGAVGRAADAIVGQLRLAESNAK